MLVGFPRQLARFQTVGSGLQQWLPAAGFARQGRRLRCPKMLGEALRRGCLVATAKSGMGRLLSSPTLRVEGLQKDKKMNCHNIRHHDP